MSDIVKIIEYSFFSGITVFFGGVFSWVFQQHFEDGPLKNTIIHSSISFGGGIIIAAVALVLVPEGMKVYPVFPMSALFFAGGLFFCCLDRFIELRGGTLAQLMAMLMDFVPEAIALGAMFGTNHNLGFLLALFIGLQNFPEAFNSYIELVKSGFTVFKTLSVLFFLSFSGIFASLVGYWFLSDHLQITAGLMLFSSGGILYLIFQDIAPSAKLENEWSPALGVNIGFLVGMIGHKLLG